VAVSLTFWGTRGSIPTPGAPTSRYGGNTPCMSAMVDQSLVVLDAGSGLRVLGRELVRHAPSGPLSIDLLLSHTHWDHIQGLPFFAPLFQRGTEVRIYGAQQNGTPLDVILQRQMDPTVFPIPLAALNARLTVTEITEEPLTVGAFVVQVVSLCHPGRTLGFALAPRAGGPMAAYLTDNELGAEAAQTARPHLVRFLRGCDTLVHDAMYFESERRERAGWGHSSACEAVELALEAECRRLVLFHHDPDHDDATIDRLLEEAVAHAARAAGGGALIIEAAREGTTLVLEGGSL